jgi:hypothetical protein
MAKQQVRSKEVSKIINNKLQDNIPRQQILDELAELYHGKNTIAVLIASAPTNERKEKYKSLNTMLVALLGLTIVLKVAVAALLLSQMSVFLLPIALIIPAFTVWLTYEVSKYKGYIYTVVGGLAIASILKSLGTMDMNSVWDILDIGVLLAISGLAFYLRKKMFPNFNFTGPKKDASGAVILE